MLLLAWQRHAAVGLRAEIARQHTAVRERAQLLAEHEQLIKEQLSVEELDRLRAERTAVAGLRAEIEAMRHRVEAMARAATPEPRLSRVSLADGVIPAAEWKNAGTATPDAALESVLWSAAGGDVEALAGLLRFDAEARAKAEGMFARLPPNLQNELGTPERLVALLTAKDVPLGAAQIVGTLPLPRETRLTTQLTGTDGKMKTVVFSLGSDEGRWHLVVPGSVVEKYATLLPAPPVPPGESKGP